MVVFNQDNYPKTINAANEDNNVDAMLELAEWYRNGQGISKNVKKAFSYVSRAYVFDKEKAILPFAKCYMYGIGTSQNLKKAAELLEQAVKDGIEDSIECLVKLYSELDPTDENKQKLFNILFQIVQDSDSAIYEKYCLAICYAKGLGVKPNVDKAIYLLEQLGDSLNGTAKLVLGGLYSWYKNNKKKAFKCFEDACEKGDIMAISTLGYCYQMGDGVGKNSEKAIEFYDKGIEHNEPISIINKGLLLLEKEQTKEEGRGLIFKAADLGDPIAIYYKGYLALQENLEEATDLLKEAEEKGFFGGRSLRNIAETVLNCGYDKTKQQEIFSALYNFYNEIKKFASGKTLSKVENQKEIYHYTSLEVLQKMLSDSASKSNNCFRLSNITQLNDPSEGKAIINFSRENQNSEEDNNVKVALHDFFPENGECRFGCTERCESHKDFNEDIFTASFSVPGNNLNMWRLYTDKKQVGICLGIPKNCFSLNPNSNIHSLAFNMPSAEKNFRNENSTSFYQENLYENQELNSQLILRKVSYEEGEKNEFLDAINEPMQDLFEQMKDDDDNRCTICNLVRDLLRDVLYLFKHEEYSAEEEYRLIWRKDIKDAKYCAPIEEGTPGNLYFETNKFLFESKGFSIRTSPKVKNHEAVALDIKYRLKKNEIDLENVKILKSELPYSG